jgi:hypothetical protein
MHKVKLSLLSVLMLAVLIACVNFTQDAYRTLSISQQGYDTALSVMGDLYKEGKLSEDIKNQAIVFGRAYKMAHNDAVIALADFETSGGEANKQAYMNASVKAAAALSKLLAYCKPFIEKGGK